MPPGRLLGGSFGRGHRLRSADLPAPGETRQVAVLVVGAGVGGLSAAWKLQRSGLDDFIVLDLEDQAGGNARSGHNAVSAFPWGAHYLPVPTRESRAVRELLAASGALLGDPLDPRPQYDERLLCHAPQERVHADGVWQEGLIPALGMPAAERAQIDRFHARMAEFRVARDAEGRRAFAIPLRLSSPAPEWRALDQITMATWMRDQGFDAPRLRWYVDYCCSDDYGSSAGETSAWAGIHYFASRDGEAANAGSDAVLTAPEGNAWLVEALRKPLGDRLRTGALAFRLHQEARRVGVEVWQAGDQRSVRYLAEHVVWAAPLFVLAHVAEDLPPVIRALAGRGAYAPWLVANLTLASAPAEGTGVPMAWDNVLYQSPGLGYVVATHQQLALRPAATVLTYYRTFAGLDPAQVRAGLLQRSREAWAEEILAELGRAHPDLADLTRTLDVFRHGHAMIRPRPGTIWDPDRLALSTGWGRVHFAHADLSGVSIFEEANHHGVAAAEAILARQGLRFTSSLA